MYWTRSSNWLALAGRILLSIIFIVSGIAKLLEWNGTMHMMAAKGIPATYLALSIATIIELIGGLSILFGVRSRVSAIVVLLYLIPVTLIMHNFWSAAPALVSIQLVNFLKNLAIMGGLALLAGYGPGRYALGKEKYLYEPKRQPERAEAAAPGAHAWR